MATSETDIANIALGWLGADSIVNLVDNDDCNRNYDICRDACLEEIDWTFAAERFVLDAPDTAEPAFGMTYKFLIPSRVLRVREVNGNLYRWRIEGRYIISNKASLEVRASVRVSDVRAFPANFVQALAARLAAVIAIPVTRSKAQASHYWQLYGALKNAAQSNDGRQGTSEKMKRRPQRRSRN